MLVSSMCPVLVRRGELIYQHVNTWHRAFAEHPFNFTLAPFVTASPLYFEKYYAHESRILAHICKSLEVVL